MMKTLIYTLAPVVALSLVNLGHAQGQQLQTQDFFTPNQYSQSDVGPYPEALEQLRFTGFPKFTDYKPRSYRGWCGTPDGSGFEPKSMGTNPYAPLENPAVWRPEEADAQGPTVEPQGPTVEPQGPTVDPETPARGPHWIVNPAVLRPLPEPAEETIDPGSQRAKSFTARDDDGTIYEVMTIMWTSNGQPRSKVIKRIVRRGPQTVTIQRQTRTSRYDGSAPPYPYSGQ